MDVRPFFASMDALPCVAPPPFHLLSTWFYMPTPTRQLSWTTPFKGLGVQPGRYVRARPYS